MRFLRTHTESLNVSKISRIAYLNPVERKFLTEKTGRPDFAAEGEGEVIADMGRVIPVTLGYLNDELVGSLIVEGLTNRIIAEWPQIFSYESAAAEAEKKAARIRADDENGDDDWSGTESVDIVGYKAMNGSIWEPESNTSP